MNRHTVIAAALASLFVSSTPASAADDKELAAIREQIRQMKESYEARLAALEQRLQEAQAAPVALPAAPPAAANAFNPNISLVLGGTYANLSQDPANYRLQGFVPAGGETGPGKRSFSLGESELTFAANIDPMFSGQLTFSLTGEDTIGVEEAYIQTRALANGVNFKMGRFLSGTGYLNSQHAHAWDFVDAPLAYQAFFRGQFKPDGLQAKWLAPTDTFVELGMEAGRTQSKNGVGSSAVFAHVGDDIGASGSWRAGLSYQHTASATREFDLSSFTGNAKLWIADAIYKWSPNGNSTHTNFKLQGEYFRRNEGGVLDTAQYDSRQSGWYVQGVYQFMPMWRTGLRYDRLSSGTQTPNALALLDAYAPNKTSLMFDYSPSEFSRLRLQLARDQSRAGVTDTQLFLQYIMSLGTHAAHAF